MSESVEAKHKIEVKTFQKPFRISKDKLSELKGVFSKKAMSRLKKEGVECPVKGKVVPFLECFTCEKFVRRVKGYVYCNG
ncbi:MAG: hypothetical protein DRO36_02380 [Candidatus Hecatellales archaeon]|nr:MAG: hypothetical protein DRO36_02380 [Candidatus Hecatellales archaeon]